MFAGVALERLSEMARYSTCPGLMPSVVYNDDQLAEAATRLRDQIDNAIHEHAVVEENGQQIYAYEVRPLLNARWTA